MISHFLIMISFSSSKHRDEMKCGIVACITTEKPVWDGLRLGLPSGKRLQKTMENHHFS